MFNFNDITQIVFMWKERCNIKRKKNGAFHGKQTHYQIVIG